MDTLISLYIGWGKEFLVLLDSDKEGMKQKQRYVDNFGILVENRIFLLSDIDAAWENISTEKLFEEEDRMKLQMSVYPETSEYSKTHFNRAIQEKLVTQTKHEFSEKTRSSFDKVLAYLTSKLDSL